MHSIEPRRLDDATQPALWVDGQLIDYKSLRRLALRLQQPMLQMLKSAGPGWESGKGPVKESVGARLARDEDTDALKQTASSFIGGKPSSHKVIGVCLPRSAHLYAAILAVLGCGAVYLPLDPQHTAQRRRFILDRKS